MAITYINNLPLADELLTNRQKQPRSIYPGSSGLPYGVFQKEHMENLIYKNYTYGGLNMSKNRYPKTRKKRNTDYSMTQRLLKQIGKESIHEIWTQNGHRRSAKILTEMMGEWVSPMVLQYMAARLFFWQRIVTDRSLPMYKGILSGKTDARIFTTIIFQ